MERSVEVGKIVGAARESPWLLAVTGIALVAACSVDGDGYLYGGGGGSGSSGEGGAASAGRDGKAGAAGSAGQSSGGRPSGAGASGMEGGEAGAGGGSAGEGTGQSRCQDDPCVHGTCAENGDDFVCTCAPGYAGDTCEEPFTSCAAGVCGNGACVETAEGPTCECELGWGGPACNVELNECQARPCLNGGTCIDASGTFSCECVDGYSGDVCEVNDDDCALDPCLNGGTCIDGVNSFVCDCPTEFRGDTCDEEFTVCTANACQNGGSCTDTQTGPVCECADGFSGTSCQINDDDCTPNPCQNGASCQDGVDTYTCQCPVGFSGGNCQTNVDDCSPNPCQNEGTCIDGVSEYSCQCDGYLGENCELPMFETVAAPNGFEYCFVNGLSADGSYMAVSCLMSFMHTYRWSHGGGLQEIPFPANAYTMTGTGIDATGNYVFGQTSLASDSGDVATAFRWSSSTGVRFYTSPEAGESVTVLDVSADGSRVLGQGGIGTNMFVWSSMTAATQYAPNSGDTQSRSGKISGNGQVVIGTSYDSGTDFSELVRWTGPTTRQKITIGGTYFSLHDVNYDGNVAVGYGDAYTGLAWVWRATSGVSQLPTLGTGSCYASGVSDNGARIVGTCQDGENSVAVLWEGSTVQRVSAILTAAGAELAGDPLSGGSIYISGDGKTLAGGYGLAVWVGRLEN
jgi:hypothetical protein